MKNIFLLASFMALTINVSAQIPRLTYLHELNKQANLQVYEHMDYYSLANVQNKIMHRHPMSKDRNLFAIVHVKIDVNQKLPASVLVASNNDTIGNLFHHFVSHTSIEAYKSTLGIYDNPDYFVLYTSRFIGTAYEGFYSAMKDKISRYCDENNIQNGLIIQLFSDVDYPQPGHSLEVILQERHNSQPWLNPLDLQKHPWLAKEEVFKPVNVKFDPNRD